MQLEAEFATTWFCARANFELSLVSEQSSSHILALELFRVFGKKNLYIECSESPDNKSIPIKSVRIH
jgi:hypothetical protein